MTTSRHSLEDLELYEATGIHPDKPYYPAIDASKIPEKFKIPARVAFRHRVAATLFFAAQVLAFWPLIDGYDGIVNWLALSLPGLLFVLAAETAVFQVTKGWKLRRGSAWGVLLAGWLGLAAGALRLLFEALG